MLHVGTPFVPVCKKQIGQNSSTAERLDLAIQEVASESGYFGVGRLALGENPMDDTFDNGKLRGGMVSAEILAELRSGMVALPESAPEELHAGMGQGFALLLKNEREELHGGMVPAGTPLPVPAWMLHLADRQ
jgi:hypothetical protein